MSGSTSKEDIETKVRAAILESKDIRRIINMKVLGQDDEDLVVGARVDVAPSTTMNEVSVIVHLAERRIRAAVPQAEVIYITPDIYLDPDAVTPSTSTIVTLSEN